MSKAEAAADGRGGRMGIEVKSACSSSSSSSRASEQAPEHKWTPYSGPVLFTGPSGLRDYRANVTTFQQAVGEGDRSNEFTSDLSYLNRDPPGSRFPLAKNGRINEIGGPVEHFKIDQCINAARYCSTLDRLKEAIRRKRPGLLRRGIVLQHDNATPHSANLTQQWLQRYGWEILPHPAHSPDLALFDFHLFGPLKRHLGGMAFETEDDLISELWNWFDNLDVDFFRVGINSLLSRWQKCIDLHKDYVEK
ncbi:histone-lysine N-methyltransferase SETMAR [Plakobranchus ocellatus]|uniref:Histone-lysine N-methyltransferase SETMAR n=1 Tax=Plakobranchus ocellatus TaxID=259542 RepID=A0AAV4DBY9_9GAST|nr:histone-lysine N-methyltransferase SETMAR [Plakobranchus ocellatus]